MVFLNPRTTFDVMAFSRTHFVVRTVDLQRSPIYESMGCTTVLPIDENEVAEGFVTLSRQMHFVVRTVDLQRSPRLEPMGCTKHTAHWRHIVVAEGNPLLSQQNLICRESGVYTTLRLS